MSADLCERCGWSTVKAKGLCHACYQYRHRYGKDRPAEAIVAYAERDIWGSKGR